jgi:Cu-Zn family superoxide dismutase
MELLNTPRRKLLVVAVAIMALAVGAALLAVSSSATADPFGQKIAFARIVNAEGDMIGAAILTQKQEGVRVFAWARGLTPGRHGIHIHAVGMCDPAAFTTAGGHFNPEMKQHGLENPAGPHGGDLPNLEVSENGLGIMHAQSDRISLLDGPTSLFDADGSALIIHAGEDDQVTDPTGNSGARVACGVIQAK